jgi:hypothetical protein
MRESARPLRVGRLGAGWLVRPQMLPLTSCEHQRTTTPLRVRLSRQCPDRGRDRAESHPFRANSCSPFETGLSPSPKDTSSGTQAGAKSSVTLIANGKEQKLVDSEDYVFNADTLRPTSMWSMRPFTFAIGMASMRCKHSLPCAPNLMRGVRESVNSATITLNSLLTTASHQRDSYPRSNFTSITATHSLFLQYRDSRLPC